ncbi:MAG TPA: tRNA dihydrouridine synthase DusB [Acidobacteriaceae bacterium]|nr:tRNA dihydrouridine synthase DusB [Acidobacteriaceae bacterium]
MKKHWDNPSEHAMPAHARVPAEFTIGNVRIAPATVLAPMAGVTDTVFRRFIKNASVFTSENDGTLSVESETSNKNSGCGLIMTEFTSADGLARMRKSKLKRYLTYYDDEHPISAQLFGSKPDTLADAARVCQDAGFDIVDLNLGCPAKRVVACNGGSGLLRDLPLIATIFEKIRAAVTIPFTVKFRMGWNDEHIVCVELAELAERCGLNAVALHARTREDGYSGQARWEYIQAVKAAVKIPVIGNGDVRTPEDACALVEQSGCDAVMIGRAAPANPWIFRQIAQYTATGKYDVPTELDRYRMIRTYFEMLIGEISSEEAIQHALNRELGGAALEEAQKDEEKSRREAVGKMKQFASWFTHGVPGGGGLRKAIYEAKNGAAVLDAVEKFFDARVNHAETIDPVLEAAIAKEEMLASTAAYCD